MNSIAILFITICIVLLLLLPRRLACLPLLLGTLFLTSGLRIEVGPFHFTAFRLIIAAGLIRIILRRERVNYGINSMDWLIFVWAGWALTSSAFHEDVSGSLTLRLGIVYNICGIYFLIRIFCQSIEEIVNLCRIIAILIVPLALEMIYEKMTGYNLFASLLGGAWLTPATRLGRIRAQGPFGHSILAGTVGAACLPLAISLWSRYRKIALIGSAASVMIVFASSSSGPVLSAMAAVGALLLWRYRNKIRYVRWLVIGGYVALELFMSDPAYYIMARIDISGGSTGWHRAKLIESAFDHLQEWYLAGTDYTRDWMPSGVSWSPDHTDITNYYLKMGVWGGLPLMLLFIMLFATGFFYLGKVIKQLNEKSVQEGFLLWGIGSSLFAHVVPCIGVSYFDQSYVLLFLPLGVIASVWSEKNFRREHST